MGWDSIVWWVDVIVKVAAALGAVVFVHELGHFLVAKACGVSCPKFYLGFDVPFGLLINKVLGRPGEFTIFGIGIPRTIGPPIKIGETEYGIGILPLGGYVKMFGQDDDPSQVAEQMQKSQVADGSSHGVEKIGPDGQKYYIDPRSYQAKTVPQRMAIISAGVIMNVIFAFIFATIAYGMGVKYLPCIVSGTMPGSPAWKARFMPGDEIVELGERKNPTFLQLRSGVTLGDLRTGIPCEVRLSGTDDVVSKVLKPTQEEGQLASVGIGGPLSLELNNELPVQPGSASASAKLLSSPPRATAPSSKDDAGIEKKDPATLHGGDTLVSINGVAVADYAQYVAELVKATDKPMTIVVRRPLKPVQDGTASTKDGATAETQLLEFEVPTQPMEGFGLVMEMGPVTAVQEDSPAAKANLMAGDRIVAVDGKPIADTNENLEGWTPVTLPEYLRKAAMEGREIKVTLRRGAGEESVGNELTLQMMPIVPSSISSAVPVGAPIAADAIGAAYSIENTVHAAAPSSPAATAGIMAGDRIDGATIYLPKNKKTGKAPDPEPVKLGDENLNWPALMDAMQFVPEGTKVELRLRRGENGEPITVMLTPRPASGVFVAARGLNFEPIYRVRTATSFAEAVRYGLQETTEALTMVFRFLQKLGGQVPLKMLGGPGTIAVAAGDAASHGLSSLLIFLTMLSANLAVINFLPIPMLDGGHMMFLVYEGVRGRPANENVVVGLHMAGFAFLIVLMVFVIGLDIHRWILT